MIKNVALIAEFTGGVAWPGGALLSELAQRYELQHRGKLIYLKENFRLNIGIAQMQKLHHNSIQDSSQRIQAEGRRGGDFEVRAGCDDADPGALE